MGYLIAAIVILAAVVWVARRAVEVESDRRDPNERGPGGLWYGGTDPGLHAHGYVGGDVVGLGGGVGAGGGFDGGGGGGDCGGGGGG
ncbi:MAG TPA: hypothetical protein VHJ34_01320 [Actinomycetota bacterium]|nr:hypothetical protein [Actinomycetota bacterium]